MKYRPEIDGLRAIAVVSVIVYHAGFSALGGGFLGVDVFFVISGFLITSLIISDLSEGVFTFANFYERRIRRIFPALFVVLLVCIPAAVVLLLPYQLTEFSWSAVSAVTFVSNIFFWKQGGYFAEASEFRPLLHTWSLAVEEQFYIFFPILAILLAKLGVRFRIICVLAIILCSLVLSEWAWRNKAAAGFFLLPTRAWELMVGSLTAYVALQCRDGLPRWSKEAMSGIGFAGLLWALIEMDSSYPLPSVWTLVPVLSTACILYAARSDTLVARLLSNRLFVGIGLLSYSMYLWHQPLFAFARAIEPELETVTLGALSVIVVILSYVSWRFVERPFRDRQAMPTRGVYVRTGAMAGMIVAASAAFVTTDGLLMRVPKHHIEWASTSPLVRGQYVMADFMLASARASDTRDSDILIVGDSFAQDLYNMLAESEEIDMSRVDTVHIRSTCQFVYNLGVEDEFLRGRNAEICDARGVNANVVARIRSYDTVLVAMRWQKWAAQRISKTVAGLDLGDDTTMVVFGTKSFPLASTQWLSLDEHEMTQVRVPLSARSRDINSVLATQLSNVENVHYVDLAEFYCSGPTSDDTIACRVFAEDGSLISYDSMHLTKGGAEYFGGKVAARLRKIGVGGLK